MAALAIGTTIGSEFESLSADGVPEFPILLILGIINILELIDESN